MAATEIMMKPDDNNYILVVDDDDDLRQTLCDLLEEEGYTTIGLGNGQQALEFLKGAIAPKLIMLDLMMPILDGWGFREKQLQDPALSKIPVLIMSASREMRDAPLSGAQILNKPVELDVLLQVVANRMSATPH